MITSIVVDPNWLSVVSIFVLPMVVALVTARVAHPGVKAVILALLALVVEFVNKLVEANGELLDFNVNAWLSTAVAVFLGSVGMHYGLLSPTQLTGANGVIQTSVQAGVGAKTV